MGFDQKILVLTTPRLVEELRAQHSVQVTAGTWLQVNGLGKSGAKLSLETRTTVVEFEIVTFSDIVTISAWRGGKNVRRVVFDAEGEFEKHGGNPRGWSVRGRKLAFEDTAGLSRWLARESIQASPDGYEVLEAFLGAGYDASTPLARAPPQLPRAEKQAPDPDMAAARFFDAARRGDLSKLEELLQAGVDPNVSDEEGNALHGTGSPAAIALLVHRGVDLERRDSVGMTPLLVAVANLNGDSEACLAALLDAGANPLVTTAGGVGVFELVAEGVRAEAASAVFAPAIVRLLEMAIERTPKTPPRKGNAHRRTR